jgi:hypothetical protein
MPEPVIMTRLVRGRPPGREFDIAFWQAAGPARIFEAAWDLVVTAAAVRGIHEDQLRLQRAVTRVKRRGSPLPDRPSPRKLGVEPVRVDIMTSVPGLDFNPAWDRKLAVDFGGETALTSSDSPTLDFVLSVSSVPLW